MNTTAHTTTRIRDVRLGAAAWCVLACGALDLLVGPTAIAEDWMFRRSYYSHETLEGEERETPPVPARTAYRRAYTGEGPGFSARGGYRYNIQTMRSGNNVDVTVLRENWFEFAP